MSEKKDSEMIDSLQLLEKLAELDKRMKIQSEDRHRLNNGLHGTLNSLANKTDLQDQVLSQIQESVKVMSESVTRVEACLIGDSKFDRQGLIKDVIEIKAVNIAISARLDLVDESAKANAAELKNQRRTVVWTAAALAGIGAVVTWIKNTGASKILGP
jgi:hypothetical protein